VRPYITDVGTGNMFEHQPGSYDVELVPMGGPPSAEERQQGTRMSFALVAHPHLLRELARGENGAYLSALAELYDVPPAQRNEFAGHLRASLPQLLEPSAPHEFVAVLDPLASAAH